MCLEIDNSVPPKKIDKNGFCLGWKVITKDNFSPYNYISLPHKYVIGNNLSSRKSVWLNDTERKSNQLNSGFHLFLDRKSARNELSYWRREESRGYCKIIKAYYKLEDVVRYGQYGKANAVVVTKLTVKSLKGVR